MTRSRGRHPVQAGSCAVLVLLALLPAATAAATLDERGPHLHGIVLDSEGAALAGCAVMLGDQRTTSAADGRFRLDPPATGPRNVLRLEASDHALREVVLPDARMPADFDLGAFRLSRGAELSGAATDAEGSPIADARVYLTTSRGHREATTGDDGSFHFPRVDPGLYDLLLVATGFPIGAWPGVQITEPRLDLGVLRLETGAGLTGALVDGEGRPLPGVTVEVVHHGGDPLAASRIHDRAARRARTDATGRFRLAGLRGGHGITIRLRDDRHALVTHLELDPKGEITDAGTLIATPIGDITGTIVDSSGEPVAGARLGSRPSGGLRSYQATPAIPVSDESGRFRIEDLAVGTHLVSVHALGYEPLEGHPVRVEAGATDLRIALRELESGHLEIHLRPATGTPPPRGVEVEIDGLSGDAENVAERRSLDLAEGTRAVWPRLPIGRYQLRVRESDGPELVRRPLDVSPGTQMVDVELSAPHRSTVVGRVVAADGSPIRFATLYFTRRQPSWFSSSTASDASGSYRVELPAGDYSVRVEHPDHVAAHRDGVRIGGGNVEIDPWRLARGTTLTGRLDGLSPDEIARLTVQAGSEHAFAPGRIHADGRFELHNLTRGVWTVTAEIAGGPRRATRTIEIGADEPAAELLLAFEPQRVLEGRVLDGGEPLAGATVLATPLDHAVASIGSAITDAGGHFTLRGLAPGPHYLNVSVRGAGRVHQRGVDLPLDGPIELAFATGRASGRVTRADDRAPLPATFVRFEPVKMEVADAHEVLVVSSHERFVGVETLADGSFEAGPLEEGAWRATVEAEGFVPGSVEFTIDDGAHASDLEIVMTPTAGLHLSITTELGPLPYALHARLRDETGRTVAERVFSPEEAERAFWKDAPPGDWRLLVHSQVIGSHAEMPVSIPGPPVDVLLPALGKLRVTVGELLEDRADARLLVVDADGAPAPGSHRDGRNLPDWPISDDRRFYVWSVEPGVYEVRVEAEDGRDWSRWVAVDANRITDVAFD